MNPCYEILFRRYGMVIVEDERPLVVFGDFVSSMDSDNIGGFDPTAVGAPRLDGAAYPKLPVERLTDEWNTMWVGRFKGDTWEAWIKFPAGTVAVAGEREA